MEETEQTIKPIPIWASVLVILLCLGGGGWIMHWYVVTEPTSHESRLLPGGETAAAVPRGPRLNPNNPNIVDNQPWIRDQGVDIWRVHTAEAMAVVAHPVNKGVVVRSLNYNNYEFIPKEHRDKIFAARRIATSPDAEAMQKSLKVTPEQVKKLRGLTAQVNMNAGPADYEQIKSLFQNWQSATAAEKPAAQAKLVAAMGEIAKRSIDPTRAAAAQRAKDIEAALSADQWKQFDAMGR